MKDKRENRDTHFIRSRSRFVPAVAIMAPREREEERGGRGSSSIRFLAICSPFSSREP